jgi:hypothetical protein
VSYLDIARSVRFDTKETKEVRTEGSNESSPGYERNEFDEKSPASDAEDSESLKARIIQAVTVEPDQFDRAEYDRLWTHWKGQDGREESRL